MKLPVKGYFAGLSRSTFLLALASFFSDISTEMLYPVLPVFLIQTLHANGSIVGLVDGFAQAVQNLVQGFSGSLSDKLQKRKPIALAGYFLSAIAKPLMGVSALWQGLFAARVVDRLALARDPRRAMRWWRPRPMRNTEARRSVLRALATMQARSLAPC